MKLKKIGAVLAGAALLGATLAGAAAQDVPPTDFFIDPDTGQPNVVIVVGSDAAAMDVVSATMIAAKIGTMTFTEETGEATFTRTFKAIHENIDPFIWWTSLGTWINDPAYSSPEWGLGWPTVDVPDASPYASWDNNFTPINYTLGSLWYFDDYYNLYWGDGDQHFDPWETHEEIQLRFDDFWDVQWDMQLVYENCWACLYGGDIDLYNSWDSTIFGNFWAWYAIPGLIYRADNIFVPPYIACYMKYNHPAGVHIVGLDYERRQTFYVPDPLLVYWGMLPQFKFLGTVYTVVDGGAVLDMNGRTGALGSRFNTPYLVTGTPNYSPQVYLYKHEPMDFGSYTVELKDADVDHNKAWFVVSKDGEVQEDFWMVLDPMHGFSSNLQQMGPGFNAYDTWNDIDGDGVIDPDEFTNVISYDYDGDGVPDYYNKWIVGRTEKDVWGDYQWEAYEDNRGDWWYLVKITDFVLDGVKVFIGAQGTIGIEIKVYWLEDKKIWYNHLCCDPWVTEPNNYQMFLDAYESGWDTHYDTTDPPDGVDDWVYQSPGTGLWPQAGLQWWTNQGVVHPIHQGNGFLDNNDGHIGFEDQIVAWFPEMDDLDRDSNGLTNDDPTIADLFDIEDPVLWTGVGQAIVEINLALCDKMCAPGCEYKWPILGPYPRDPPYFTIEVTDVQFTCADGDGIDYDTIMEEIQVEEYTTVTPADVDETGLVMLDTELDFAGWKAACDYNLILIGGPVANIIVKQLVDEGISAVDWTTSPGEWEYIEAPYDGCDILILAGMDRDATRAAAQDLIDQL
jgi:hypothetical protein